MFPILWRVIPWNPDASAGEPFSPEYLPEQSGQGRFDLPTATPASARYFATSPEHSIAERIQDLRNGELVDAFLFERGHRLALCRVHVEMSLELADLCDPGELSTRGLRPDRLAYRDRSVTRAIAAQLHADPTLSGFRWWSSFFGEWHTVVLFSDRLQPATLRFDRPTPLESSSVPLRKAAIALGIEIRDTAAS